MGTYARKALVPVIALAALVLAPSSAGAVTFGANLNRTPNNTITCGDFQSPYYSAATFNSCSWEFTPPRHR